MSYEKTAWANSVTPLNESNLNHLETQYDEAMKDVKASFSPLSVQQQALSAGGWAADKVTAAGFARANYDDAASTTESWANLSGWTFTPGKLQVSGGKLFGGDTSGGASSGAVRSSAFPTFSRAVLKATVTVPSGSTEIGDLILGLSSDTPGSTPASTASNVKGVDFQPTDQTIRLWDRSRANSVSIGTYVPGGTYYVTITLDATTVSVTVTQPGSTYSANGWLDRTGWSPQTPYVFNNDTRMTAGKAIGALGFVTALSSIKARSGVEDLSPFWAHIADNGTYRLHIALPKNYDPRRPAPVVLAFHGHGTNSANYGSGNNNNTAMMSAFTNAGYIVCSASLNSNLTTWGSDAGLAVYEYAYRYLKSYFAISSVIFFANSMGGIESLLTLARNKVPCDAWIGTVPTVSLKNNFARYGSAISASYGAAADGSDFDTKTAGHDPSLMSIAAFRGVPMMAMIATDDTNVLPEQNWALIEASVQKNARAYQRINVTGGHSSPSLGDQVQLAVSFAQQFVNDTLA